MPDKAYRLKLEHRDDRDYIVRDLAVSVVKDQEAKDVRGVDEWYVEASLLGYDITEHINGFTSNDEATRYADALKTGWVTTQSLIARAVTSALKIGYDRGYAERKVLETI